jgi:hypothetical protein
MENIDSRTPEQKATDAAMPAVKANMNASPEELEIQENNRIKDLVVNCITIGEDYRSRFRKTWDEIEKQVKLVPPADWDKKEDWQSKVFIGLQAKTSESAFANLNAMVFPSDKFFSITSTKERDRDEEGALEDLFTIIMHRGKFYFHKDFVLEDAIDHGTSFLKMLVRPDKTGIEYVWRSCYDTLVDPNCRDEWSKARFWVDQYPKDPQWLVQELGKGKKQGMYQQQQLKAALEFMSSSASSSRQEEIDRIRNIDGTGWIAIPKAYKTLILNEFWGWLPMPVNKKNGDDGYEPKLMVVTMINKDFVIRCEECAYPFIPAVPARIKPRKFDFYAKGYLLNGMGTQDLMNSMVNLGFDSAKINAIDIIVLDQKAIADTTTIQYKPLQVWLVKGNPNDAVRMTRQSASSALRDLLVGINILDQIHQDVTGVTRQAEGSNSSMASGQGDKTLGEYKLKLAAVDRRFLSIARRFEEDFTKNLLEMMYAIIIDPKLFSQQACTEMIGMRPIMAIDPASGQSVKMGEMPRLVLADLGKKKSMDWSFSGNGVMQFSQRQETLEKLQKALEAAVKNPTLGALTNIDVLWRRIFQLSEVPDWEEIVKSKEQVQKMQEFLQNLQQGVPANGMPQGNIGMPSGLPSQQTPMGMPMGQPQGAI